MKMEIKKLLGTGLSGGYGAGKYGKVTRAGFPLDSSDYSGPEGTYHDELAAHQLGGGQELVKLANGETATRVYAGGTLDSDILQKLGLTNDDVSKQLKFFLGKLGNKTRLDEEMELTDERWKYSYKLLEAVKDIPVLVGAEKISYDDSLVFIHFIINSPVK
jgi:hypothetical protein